MRKIFFVINQEMMQKTIFRSFAYHFANAAIFVYNYMNLIYNMHLYSENKIYILLKNYKEHASFIFSYVILFNKM